MTLRLDHIVIAVDELDTAIADYQALGFNVLRGGDHPGRTTHNALVVFADGSYFELIAWKAPAPGERWWQLLQRRGQGLVDFALLPASTAGTVAEAARRGLALQGPLDGGRLRPDGERLRWQTARPPSSDLPFLCGDLTPRALRVPEGDARVHPNGALGVASLAVAVHDLEASRARYQALFGEATPVGRAEQPPGEGGPHALIALGDSVLRLSVDGAGEQGPRAVVLRTADGTAPLALDARRTHGARIAWDAAEARPASYNAQSSAPETVA